LRRADGATRDRACCGHARCQRLNCDQNYHTANARLIPPPFATGFLGLVTQVTQFVFHASRGGKTAEKCRTRATIGAA
jgi:hypothetical protein